MRTRYLAGDRKPSEITDDYWIWADGPGPQPDRNDPHVGKWLIFVRAGEIDDWWARIWPAVDRGDLGFRAKAATARDNTLQRARNAMVICAYTRDWRDKDDVRRVLAGLRELGVSWRLSYKTDDATLAGRYGDGSAIYVSQPGTTTFDDRSGSS